MTDHELMELNYLEQRKESKEAVRVLKLVKGMLGTVTLPLKSGEYCQGWRDCEKHVYSVVDSLIKEIR